ncbi:hypothetical protein [Mesobacterium pallidum]|uniref:hypothetical protein n=1 Tax=Mesobacterium pallidum TaxID=2872037 RepID=UPI001EE2E41A|nr:hypothetical protein [Mesobacterium pallidum]
MKSIILAAVLAASPAVAGQPISESLLECAALFDSSNRWFPERASSPKARKIQAVTDALLGEAERVAQEEGRREVVAYMTQVWHAKQDSWDARGKFYMFTDDGQDWFAYCASLARHRGLDLSAAAD